jgi:predicted DNA-binding ribbon-helix-helix protein
VPKLISTLDSSRDRGNLSSAIRVFVLDHYREVPSTGTQAFHSAVERRAI